MRNLLPAVGTVIEALRAGFVDADPAPLGGAMREVEHRPGADVALDGLFGDACPGLVWANVTRIYRTLAFPQEEVGEPCRGPRAVVIQVGAARCVATLDDQGYAPSAEAMEHDALVGLDDAARLERAVCRAAAAAEDRGIIDAAVWSPLEPIGPQGGALAWVMELTVQLAR
ncbi:hypothetical protein [Corynebacterium sphenisci]|uniref:hypothetical protein n=1 Tax=Corynebacterium sphenisci TaxID=191493 RepID=UPI0026E0B1D6|nr:hypothetical protein [Corynebacterium sphenisci]MDO5730785.1 hypothetical protein [Corynebacterium sphenisci]